MSHYRFEKGNVKKLSEKPFALESEIKKLVEGNLELFFNLKYVRSEFQLQGLRVDTFAFDEEARSFVIIEYKQSKNYSVIDQGFAYLALLLNNKADFVLEYNERIKPHLKKDDVDWTQSRVIFVAPSFTGYQRQATNFKDLPMELWEIKQYEDSSISLNELVSFDGAESIKTVSKSGPSFEKVSKEVKKYTEDSHLDGTSEALVGLYQKLKGMVLNIGEDISIRPRKLYVGFIRSTNFMDVEFQKARLKVFLNMKKGTLNDSKGLARDISQIGHWGNGDYEITLSDDKELEYIVSLVKQAYQRNK